MARAHQSRSNIYRPDFYDDAMIFLIYFAPTATVFESPEPRVLKGSIITLYYLIFYTQVWLCFAILLSDLLLTQQFFTEGQTENVMTYHVSTML